MPKFQKCSIDEALGKRKDFTNDSGMLFKANTAPASYDEEKRSAIFIMSAETEDRHRDVVVQSGIDFSHFDKNPVSFFNHRSYEPPIGSWSEIKTVNGRPKRTEGKHTFVEEGVDESADTIARHVGAGTIRASSIGFMPKSAERILDDDGEWTWGYRFPEIELYECSIVCVPAVREALVKGKLTDEDIVSLEVIEEFLDHLKDAPAVAAAVDRLKYEGALKSAFGEKTFITFDQRPEEKSDETVKVQIDVEPLEKVLGEIKNVLVKLDANTEPAPIEGGETDTPDPMVKELEQTVCEALSGFEEKIEEIADDDGERKGILESIVEGIKSLFSQDEEAEAQPASSEEKEALKKRVEELQDRLKKAA